MAEVKDDFDRSVMPELGPTPHYQPPRFERRRLSNGLELRVVERHELPIVTVDLVVKSGETLAPMGKEGLATLAASLLEEGTKSRTSLQLAGELSEIGATLGAGASLEFDDRQPDHSDPSPGPCPGPLRGRIEESVVPRQGAGPAEAPAAVAPQGPHR